MVIRAGALTGLMNQPTGQTINGSLLFNGPQYLTRTPGTAGNRKSWTFSTWVKRYDVIETADSYHTIFGANSDGMELMISNSGVFNFYDYSGGAYQYRLITSRVFRDPAAWFHVVAVADTTNSTAGDRWRLYINGTRVTNFSTETYGSQNYDSGVNSTGLHVLGRYGSGADTVRKANVYLTNTHLIDGLSLDPSYFGFTDPLTNTWRPKKYTGTFGTNGFFLPMDNQDNFEKDKSGNGNDFTKNNFSGTFNDPDVFKDSPSGAVFGGRATGITTTSSAPANYCTWNPLSGQNQQLADGNLDAESSTISSYATIPSTMAMTNGKYYAEFTYRENINGSGDGSNFFRFGISQTDRRFEYGSDPLGTSRDFGWQGAGTLRARTNGSNSYTYSGNTVADGDILSLAFDADAGKLWIARNGTWATNSGGAGDPASGNNPDYSSLNYSGGYFFVAGPYAGAASPADGGGRLSAGLVGNWGQKPFKYAPPKGFLPLNSASARPNKVVPRPDQYVGISTWTGDGNTGRNIKTLQFKPDLVWIKQRSATRAHALFDSVRGANKRLQSSSNNAETTHTDQMSAFIDNGFTVEDNNTVNVDSGTYVGWSWRAGGNKNTFNVDDVGYATFAASGTTAGDITPTGTSIGTKQGFSIIKYTGSGTSGDTLPHGLSQTPDLIITKCLDASSIDWIVKPVGLLTSESHMLILNGSNAEFQGTGGHISAQSSTTVTLTEGSNDGNYNNAGDSYVMYAWHSVPGLQKFGRYVGNNNADGPYVELGFRPALLWVKRTDSTGNWVILDTKREPFNPVDTSLYADTTDADYAPGQDWADLLSNGFKIRATYGEVNGSSKDYIYCAWAESPASNLFGGQSKAR